MRKKIFPKNILEYIDIQPNIVFHFNLLIIFLLLLLLLITGAALKHFQDTGSLYPLCVKLGTITANSADVWSYAPDEDCK